MKTQWDGVGRIRWIIATLMVFQVVSGAGARAQESRTYQVDGKGLTAPERYILARAEKGEIADLLEPIQGKAIQGRVGELGLAAYVQQLPEEERQGFLQAYRDQLGIRAKFLETLLTRGFPGFKIHRRGVRIANAIVEEPLDFEGAEVEHELWLANGILQGGVNFRDSWFKHHLGLSGAELQGKADFHRVKVGKSIFVNGTRFHEEVDFSWADIMGAFVANEAQFLNDQAEANFNSMKVGAAAFFDNATFQGPVDLRFSSFQSFQFIKLTYQSVRLEGMTYKNLIYGDNWKNALKLLEKSEYHAQPYRQLATCFQESGYPDQADAVFITGKQREWWETWSWRNPLQWPLKILEKVFFGWGVGYGRHPGRVFYFSALFVIFGTLIFSRPEVLTWQGGRPFKRIRLKRAFWYSLDAYLPFISLGPDKFYQVNPEVKVNWGSLIPSRIMPKFPGRIRTWLTDRHLSVPTYFYIHQLAGYVLVSIGIAAITGIIK